MTTWEKIGLGLMIYLAVAGWVRVREEENWRESFKAFSLRFPVDVDAEQAGRWVGTLAGMMGSPWWWFSIPRWWPLGIPRWPITLELVATRQGVQRVLIIPEQMVGKTLGALAAVMPGVRADELPNFCASQLPRWRIARELRLTGTRQLLDVRRAEDTARHVLACLQPLHSAEHVRIQWIIAGARPSWRARHDDKRRDKDFPPKAVILRWRTAHPMLTATCRICIASENRARARHLLGGAFAALRGMNALDAYVAKRKLHPRWWVARRTTTWTLPLLRWPFTLTSTELGGLLGLVSSHDLAGLPHCVARSLPPSPVTPSHGLVLARSNHPTSDSRLLCLHQEDRLRHLWIAGPTGVGKSTLLANMISYDIHRGHAVIAIDARGDLITDVLARVPDNRAEDVIVVDPTATDHPIGFNPLASPHKERAAEFVLHVLHSIYADSWGPRTADVLRASLLTLTHTTPTTGGRYTLCELPELLTNPGFRRPLTTQPLPAGLGEFWRWYEALSDRERLHVIAPVLNKLRAFTLSTPLRLLLGQSGGLDFTDMFTTHNRIVLVPLKKGLLGAETAMLIGSLMVAAVWQATLTRSGIPAEQRHPVWMYLDEFQDIVRLPIDMADMLAQARGLKLGLILAHQFLNQLDLQVRAAVLGTTQSQLVFQLQHEDARILAPRFAPLTVTDLTGLAAFDIALRACVGGATLGPVTGHTYPLPSPARDPAELAAASAARYGQPRHTIDAQLAARSHTPTLAGSAPHPNRVPLPRQAGHTP